MGSTSDAGGLGNQVLLDKIDRLRELTVGTIVSLPQLVVVGDQSSGKSSVLESLTGFSFPRAVGLCTRYATQITCRRELQRSVSITIIPRPDANDFVKQRLRKFHRYVDAIDGQDFAEIFEEANYAMGIRSGAGLSEDEDEDLITFSEDILKIEISGPDQPALTVIDVPGIFRTATPGLTTESDISLVTSMVKRYMKDSRTIILAVIPCNVDIATQEILKLAKDADPQGARTMGVLTKPDLAPERAMQQNILDLIQGKRQDLKLGYCVVKNRGSDDGNSTLQMRNDAERAFFRQEPWSAVVSSNRVGIQALKVRLRELLMDISKKEFPTVKAEIAKRLADCRKKLEAMGVSRADEKAQRAYLGKLAANFEKIVGYSLNAYYTEDPIFNERLEMRLITRIIELNEVFSQIFSQRGHTRYFDDSREDDNEEKHAPDDLPRVGYEFPTDLCPDLVEIILPDRFSCPKPSNDSIMEHIEDIFRKSRGPELGTFGGALLGTIFKEQSKRWEDLVVSHVSDAIILVHDYILELLNHVFSEKQVLRELFDNVLLEKLQASYKRAMDHARFLLEIEREGKPVTFNDYFNAELQRCQSERLHKTLDNLAINDGDTPAGPVVKLSALNFLSVNKSDPEQVREYLHDILRSYYQVSIKRFVDVVCQQVIDHFLLNGKDSPLHVFSTELVFGLSSSELEMIAEEDLVTKQDRERLGREIESLQAAMQVLRG
ncbi:Interferon-induced GTP-binding protein Mx1 [Cytospora mali]|uniref:Interferon-induced GTP-binding protein Mx1 n=1 Tax=Cytospora mali TaxID=578113 RepID=A0A194VZX7_CYTMA|nr:Interferon-induced GTP-binding protein Mx1 [Valsa mali]